MHFYRFILSMLLALAATTALAQGDTLAVFSQNEFEDWTYNRSSIELNTYNISRNRVCLYIDNGTPYHLTSPLLNAGTLDSLIVTVKWNTPSFNEESFVLARVPLTAAVVTQAGVTLDSVTLKVPTKAASTTLRFPLPVDHSQGRIAVRLAAWKADVTSNGAVRNVVITGRLWGDVNSDGRVDAADIAAIVRAITQGIYDPTCDLNRDGRVDSADISTLASIIAST